MQPRIFSFPGRDGQRAAILFFIPFVLIIAVSILATLVIFPFRYFWNDFLTPLIYLTSLELKTLPLGMADFVTEYMVILGPQVAASLISTIPVIILYSAGQNYFARGTMSAGVEG
jgi:multiple sugar transport system permease protein